MVQRSIWHKADFITAQNSIIHITHRNIFSSLRRYLWNNYIITRWHILNMKAGRLICQLHCTCAGTGETEISYSFHSFQTHGHFQQLAGRTLTQPQAISGLTIDELLRAVPRLKPLLGGWLFLNEILHFLFGE